MIVISIMPASSIDMHPAMCSLLLVFLSVLLSLGPVRNVSVVAISNHGDLGQYNIIGQHNKAI